MPSMSQAAEDSQDHRDDEEIVLGVDTHKDTHVAAVITILGVLVATAAFPTTSAGYGQLLAEAGEHRQLELWFRRCPVAPVGGIASRIRIRPRPRA